MGRLEILQRDLLVIQMLEKAVRCVSVQGKRWTQRVRALRTQVIRAYSPTAGSSRKKPAVAG